MLIDAMYYAIFYDVSRPKTVENALYKRINLNKYLNITDGIIEKVLELDKVQYRLLKTSTFHIQNSVDNTFFVVCDITKL